MRRLLLLSVILSWAGCKSIQTTINQTGTGHTATVVAGEEPGPTAAGAGATAVEAIKPEAPVQTGTGNTATDNTKAGQRNGSAATGAGSSASNEIKKGGTPWYVWVGVVLAGAAAGWYVRGQVSRWSWWPAWARPD